MSAVGEMPPLPTLIDLDDVKTMDIRNHHNCDMFINNHLVLNNKKAKGKESKHRSKFQRLFVFTRIICYSKPLSK